MKVIETERLLLRTWQIGDVESFCLINQDPKVIEFLLGPLTIIEAHEFIDRITQQFDDHGFTLWAAEEKYNGKLMGYIGLNVPTWEAAFCPCVEIGWRLGSQYWGKGYATEGAKAVLDYGFNHCNLGEIVSFTVPANIRSIRVMERIGMQRDLHGDFAHPKLPLDHELSKHVLYRIKNDKLLFHAILFQGLENSKLMRWKKLFLSLTVLFGYSKSVKGLQTRQIYEVD